MPRTKQAYITTDGTLSKEIFVGREMSNFSIFVRAWYLQLNHLLSRNYTSKDFDTQFLSSF